MKQESENLKPELSKLSNIVSLILLIASLGLLGPGLYLDIFSVKFQAEIISQFANINSELFNQTRSILQTVWHLYLDGNHLVAVLIFLFSVLVPFVKALMLLVALLSRDLSRRQNLSRFINRIAKWSMADVFVVAIFLCFLSTQGQATNQNHEIIVLGMRLPFKIQTELLSNLGAGFWFFCSYCILSIAAGQLFNEQHGLRDTSHQS